MEKSNINLYLTVNAKYFEPTAIPIIRQKLEQASDDDLLTLQAMELNDPTIVTIISILFGMIGIDRFLVGDIGMGVLKLLTAGLCGILAIVDWFIIGKRAKEINLSKISMVI